MRFDACWRQVTFALAIVIAGGFQLNAQILSNFVAITPCRVVDTRNADGALGGPIIQANTSRSFPLPTSTTCTGLSSAAAYSLNVTVVPSNSLSYLTIWPTGVTKPVVSTLNDFEGTVVANAATVQAGTAGAISVYVTDEANVVIDINGYYVANNNSSTSNTSFGQGALAVTAGAQNTAIGAGSLATNFERYQQHISWLEFDEF